ncbi:MAG: recombination protein O N-terminal domain-containing protein [Elusimicrobiota bacterium]|nr:recombination protein O N-terminal domain-containing protein [Elusimicrobiota bacterium]
MIRIAKSKGVILDNRHICDNKNRVAVFTEKYGKVVSFVTGYGKPASHWAGVFEGGNILELSFLQRGTSYTVTGWEMIYQPPEKNIMDFAVRELILDATSELVPLTDPDPGLFRWLIWCLRPFGGRKMYAYLARLIYRGGFLNFSDKMIMAALDKNFEEFLAGSSPDELAKLLKREMNFIQNFIGRPLKSYDFFKQTARGQFA